MALFKPSNAGASTKLLGYPVSTSVRGRPIPLVYGTARVSPNLVWLGNWTAKAIGSKLKGGGGKGGAGQQYDYHAAVQMSLCQGPILTVGQLWVNNVRFSLSGSTQQVVIPGSGIVTVQFGSQFLQDSGVVILSPYSVSANDFGSPGITTISGTQAIRLQPTASISPGPGTYHVDPTTGTYTFNPAQIGDLIQIGYIWNQASSTHGAKPAAAIGLALLTGDIGQPPWTYLASNFPNQAIGYSEVALLAAEDFDLGSAGTVPNLSIETYGQCIWGFPDVNGNHILDAPLFVPAGVIGPATASSGIIYDLLTNPLWGAGFAGGDIGDLTDAGNYCLANGIFVSLVMESQQPATQWIKNLLLIGNANAFWSEGKLKFRSYGDTTAVGNGVTFTPQTAPIYDLDSDDFLVDGPGQSAYVIERPTVKDADNRIVVEWSNRDNAYNVESVYEDDQAAIDLYGQLRVASPIVAHEITSVDVAKQVANVQVQRSVYLRRKHKFVLGAQYCALEPMDLVTVTVVEYGLVKTPVRLINIEEDDKLRLHCEAEDFPWGTAKPTLNPKQQASNFGPGYYADPGPVRIPIFWEPPPAQTQGTLQPFLFIGLTGGLNWGGADVWVAETASTVKIASQLNSAITAGTRTVTPTSMTGIAIGQIVTIDVGAAQESVTVQAVTGSTFTAEFVNDHPTTPIQISGLAIVPGEYANVGRQNGAATMGALTADYVDAPDPDDTDTLKVDLTESFGELNSFTADQENAFTPLALIDDELVAYRTATLTGPYAYDVTHVRRGVYGTPIQTHVKNTQFLYFDEGIFTWQYDKSDVGKTLYFKFTSFNRAGQREQNLADVEPFTYRIRNPRSPYPWNPNATISNMAPNSPVTNRTTFTIQQSYETLTDGSILPRFLCDGIPPPNHFSTKTTPPDISFASFSSTGGTIAGGSRVVVAVVSVGSDGYETGLSVILEVLVPVGTNTNKLNFNIVFANAADTGIIYVTTNTDALGLTAAGTISAAATTFLVADTTPIGNPAPDSRFDHFEIHSTIEVHGGIWAGSVLAVGSGTLQFAPDSAWTVNQLANRFIVLTAKANNSAMNLIEAKITANTADTWTLDRDLTGLVAVGDVVMVRSCATSCTATVVTDTAWINGGPGQPGTGLTPNAERGNVMWVMGGTGVGQRIPISANDATSLTLASPLTVLLDLTSIVIVVRATPTSIFPTKSMDVATGATAVLMPSVDDTEGQTYIVEVLTADADGDTSEPEESPFREIFQPGKTSSGSDTLITATRAS